MVALVRCTRCTQTPGESENRTVVWFFTEHEQSTALFRNILFIKTILLGLPISEHFQNMCTHCIHTTFPVFPLLHAVLPLARTFAGLFYPRQSNNNTTTAAAAAATITIAQTTMGTRALSQIANQNDDVYSKTQLIAWRNSQQFIDSIVRLEIEIRTLST